MLLRVLGPAPGVCLALGPVFPEVAHRGSSLVWSGGAYPVRELLTSFVLCPLCEFTKFIRVLVSGPFPVPMFVTLSTV